MTRWNAVADLYDTRVEVDGRGTPARERVLESRVFANRYDIGLSALAAGQSEGLAPDAVLQVRSAEYRGQTRCLLDGREYTVEKAVDSGEFTKLTLKRRLQNAAAGGGEGAGGETA